MGTVCNDSSRGRDKNPCAHPLAAGGGCDDAWCLGLAQLFFAPCSTHFFSNSILSLGNVVLLCGMRIDGAARPSISMIMALVRLSPGLTIAPNFVPFIRLYSPPLVGRSFDSLHHCRRGIRGSIAGGSA